ncbi:MAG: NTP transferase domain-containing protein [Burkholderiaceae bacterium]|nr:NTP transferase domain-containing protein [Burkholderiaceae bacterium]
MTSNDERDPRAMVLVLASGRGERFRASGGSTHKLHALLGGRRVLDRTLDAVRASGLAWHLEDAGHPGMGDSIAAAVRATAHAPAWLVLPGDLPLIRASTLLQVAQALARHAVVVPRYLGQRGHPVGFAAACRESLLSLTGERGAAAMIASQAPGAVASIEVDDPGCVTDIDTVDDLVRAERLLQAR